MVELQATFVEYNKELEKKQKELTDPIFERVIGAIKRIAGTESYDLIVDRATVAFARSDLDLTDRVIQLANGVRPAAAPGGRRGTGRAAAPAPTRRRPGRPRQAVTWDGVVRLRGDTLAALAARHGGARRRGGRLRPRASRPSS